MPAVAMVAAASFSGGAAGQTLTSLYTFTGAGDGATPIAGVISDGAGNLYGTTFWGGTVNATGSNGNGTVFKLTPNGSGTYTESVLYAFSGGNDGGLPGAGLIADTAGNLYGTTEYGGTSGNGVVFKVTPAGVETVLYSFNGTPDGSRPLAGLIFDTAGNLYGTTQFGGTSGNGTVFMVTPAGAETVLYSFLGANDGEFPAAGLLRDTSGNLFGTTQFGGSICGGVGIGCGTVFELTPTATGSYSETVLYRFSVGTDGANPRAGLIADAAGNLYGTTFYGGSSCPPLSCGTVFRLAPNGNGTYAETVLYAFTGNDGANPIGGLIADAVGSLYGTTSYGGTSGDGTVFKLTPSATIPWPETVLASFVDGEPGNPAAGLFSDGPGSFYGTTPYIGCLGGGCGHGAVFKLTDVFPVTTAGGTVNQVAKFDSRTDITNSQIFDNGINVGIGTTSPLAKLTVPANNGVAVDATTAGEQGIGVLASATFPTGVTNAVNARVVSSNGVGVVANATSQTGFTRGVDAEVQSPDGIGVLSLAPTAQGGGISILGVANQNVAIAALNASGTGDDPTLVAISGNNAIPTNPVFLAGSGPKGFCEIDVSGDLTCTGQIRSLLPFPLGARTAAFSAVQSPEDWFEDFGSSHLSGGAAIVKLDAAFAKTINSRAAYHVFLTPDEDCKGLYVKSKSADSFEVRELDNGHSNVAFEYRIVAHPPGHETTRMKDATEQVKSIERQQEKLRKLKNAATAGASSEKPNPAKQGGRGSR